MSCSGCVTGCPECTSEPVTPIVRVQKPRSLVIQPGEVVRLGFLFRGPDGEARDTDTFPTISIIDTTGAVVVNQTSQGVFKIADGEYGFDFQLSLHPDLGVWRDVWEGQMDGFDVRGEGTFQVNTTQLPATNTDGYQHLGDDPGFCYSQTAICNINKVLKALKRRLKSSGTAASCDEYGNIKYNTCDIFSTDELVTFIADSMSQFNQVPHLTFFTYDDTSIVELFFNALVQGALYQALGAQALIERGREFTVSDSGLGFTPPTVSELLNSQYQKEMDNFWDKIKLLKANLAPGPLGLGTLRPLAANPQFRRLRWLRERQVY